MRLLPGALNAISFYSAFVAAVLQLRAASTQAREGTASPTARERWPRTTAWLAFAIAVPTIGQVFAPDVLSALRRDAAAIASGEWWRLATALFVQDGGLGGSLSNLVGLVLVGWVAETLWGGRLLLAIFFAGGLCAEVVALWWQPIGAGNSIANVSVAASLAVWCLVHRRTTAVVVPASVAIASWAALLALRDIHAAAAVFGGLIGAGLSWREAHRTSAIPKR
jgi:hypothetical protein